MKKLRNKLRNWLIEDELEQIRSEQMQTIKALESKIEALENNRENNKSKIYELEGIIGAIINYFDFELRTERIPDPHRWQREEPMIEVIRVKERNPKGTK